MNIKFPHWLQLGIGAVGVLLLWLSGQVTAGAINLPPWAAGALSAAIALGVGLGWWSPSAMAAKPTPPRGFTGLGLVAAIAGVGVLAFAAVVCLSGCSAAPPVVPQTPENAQPIADCQGIEQTQSAFVVGDYAFTGAAAGAGVVAAALPSSNASGKTDLAIAGAASAGVAGVLTGLVAFERGKFQSGQCQQYLGPLPSTPFGAKAVQP